MNKNRKAIIYFTGIHSYFLYHYIRLQYLDYDFYIVDIPSFGFNNNYKYNNITIPNSYFDDENLLNEYLYTTFNYLYKKYNLNNSNYDEINLLGFSAGGLIILNFMSEYEKKPINNLTFNKILLESPLTHLYFISNTITTLYKYLSYFIGFFSNYFNLSPYTGQNSNESITFNKCLDNIYSNLNLNINKDIYQIDLNYMPDINQPKYTGWLNCCDRIYKKLYYSQSKINTTVYCALSTEYTSNATYYSGDLYVNPDYIINDINKICKVYKLKQFISQHELLLKPFNVNNNLSCIDIIKFFLN